MKKKMAVEEGWSEEDRRRVGGEGVEQLNLSKPFAGGD